MRFEGTGKFEAGRVEVRTLTGVVINGKTLPGVLTTKLQPPRMMVVQYLSPLNAAARELVKAARAAAALAGVDVATTIHVSATKDFNVGDVMRIGRGQEVRIVRIIDIDRVEVVPA
jgi:hypothetical protein